MMKLPSSDIKMVIMDIGNTIFDKRKQKEISANLFLTIERLRKNNIKIGVCTMRPYNWCKKMIKVPLDFYICLNGSFVVVENKIMIDKRISNSFSNDLLLSYGRKNCYYKNDKSLLQAQNLGFLANKKGHLNNPYIVSIFNVSQNDIDNFKNKYTTYFWEKDHCLNIQNKNTSNLLAIEFIKKYYNIDNYLYFGDAPNDIEIFKNNKHSILVKNGFPDLKAYAFDLCDECILNGVGKYLDKFYNLKD